MNAQLLVRDQSAMNSSDAHYYFSLRVPNGGERVKECIAALPSGSCVAVARRSDSYQMVPGQMICLELWSQGHVPMEFASEAADIRARLVSERPVAVFWLDAPPPDWLPKVVALGERCWFTLLRNRK